MMLRSPVQPAEFESMTGVWAMFGSIAFSVAMMAVVIAWAAASGGAGGAG
jgi:hypothetical protein